MSVPATYTLRRPAWLWPELAERLAAAAGRLEIPGAFSAAERKVLRKRRKIAPSRWAERHRWVSLSAVPGPWRNEVAPYGVGIMDASFFESVREIVICGAPQTGKSDFVNNCIGYAIDRAPGPALYTYPDRDTGRENARDRIQTMITDSPRLRGYVRSVVEDLQNLYIRLAHMPIYFGWARSVARLSNKPIKYLVQDEVDKFAQAATSKEADPISLAEKRLRTYRGSSKNWKISSPSIEAGPSWQAFLAAEARFDFHVACPFCGAAQRMVFGTREEGCGIRWPAEARDPNEIERANLARYECRECHAHWDDEDRNRAVRAGEWRERESGLALWDFLRARRPAKIAFHIPAWLSYFVGLSECAAAFLKGAKNKAKLKDFQNGYAAEPWVEYAQVRKEEAILSLRDDRPRGAVPAGGVVQKLTAGVDTQDDGFWYAIYAWGWPIEGGTMPGWEVRSGFALSLSDLARYLWEDELADADGVRYAVTLALQDAGGHRTAEVYDFARRHPGRLVPTFGRDTMAVPHNWSAVQYYPGKKKPIPGGLRILNVNTKYYKDDLARRLAVDPGDPGALRFCAEFRDDYARHFVSEVLNQRGLWECPPGRPNHLWDCAVLALTAADVLDLKFRRPPRTAAEPPPPAPAPATMIQQAAAQRQALIRRRPAGSWMGGIA
jgi:phage terminase large subunit GpA-like protein